MSVLTIHHCLHGYSDGHRLLASSRPLAKDEERLLAILSDLSGNSGGAEFDPYLTGYSLPDRKQFALAKTWQAPEMERPGCVWTHTLLLTQDMFPIGDQLHALTDLFIRPKDRGDVDDYRSGIQFSDPEYSAPSDLSYIEGQSSQPWIKQFIKFFYGKLSPVLVIADSSKVERVFLETWCQQWGSLQQNFRFCTLAISPRSVNGVQFDAQAVPHSFYRRGKWSEARVELIDSAAEDSGSVEDWVRLVAADLIGEGTSTFREFLERMGPEFENDRTAFGKLARVYCSIVEHKSDESPTEVLREIAEIFQSPEEARDLKVWILISQDALKERLLPNATGEALLRGLFTSGASGSFLDAKSISKILADRWHGISMGEKLKLVSWITSTGSMEESAALLAGLANNISSSEFLEFDFARDLATKMVISNPLLLADSQVWKRYGFSSRVLSEVGNSLSKLESAEQKNVLVAAFEAGADTDVIPLVSAVGSDAMVWFASWLNERPDWKAKDVERTWDSLIRVYAPEILAALADSSEELSGATVALIARAVGTRIRGQREKTWAKIVKRIRRDAKDFDIGTKAALLDIGLTGSGKAGSELIRFSFEDVHRNLYTNTFPYGAWDQLQRNLPWIGYFDSWDKAERLRRGVSQWFYREERSVEEFLSLADDSYILDKLLRSMLLVEHGRAYLKSGADELTKSETYCQGPHGWKLENVMQSLLLK